MKVLTGIAIVQSAEGKRIAYTYSEINDAGEVISTGNKGNFIAVTQADLNAIAALETAAKAHM